MREPEGGGPVGAVAVIVDGAIRLMAFLLVPVSIWLVGKVWDGLAADPPPRRTVGAVLIINALLILAFIAALTGLGGPAADQRSLVVMFSGMKWLLVVTFVAVVIIGIAKPWAHGPDDGLL